MNFYKFARKSNHFYSTIMKLLTIIDIPPLKQKINYEDKILFMGSCFATEVGHHLGENGFDIKINPFGVLYNPASLNTSFKLLSAPKAFTDEDVISTQRGYVSFFHHSSFCRPTKDEFLSSASQDLARNAEYFANADVCVVTLGTAWVFRHLQRNMVVSNCHKIAAKEFVRERLKVEEIVEMLGEIVEQHPQKQWIFTVSPIRHLSDGALGNQVSKATLLLAVEQICLKHQNASYFPAYEIMMDELRDYRFYAPNMTHPSPQAVEYIFERFCQCAINPTALPQMAAAKKQTLAQKHIVRASTQP